MQLADALQPAARQRHINQLQPLQLLGKVLQPERWRRLAAKRRRHDQGTQRGGGALQGGKHARQLLVQIGSLGQHKLANVRQQELCPALQCCRCCIAGDVECCLVACLQREGGDAVCGPV